MNNNNDESDKLRAANNLIEHQNEEREKRESELIIANDELTFQNDEKDKRAAELVIANKELAYQNEEKQHRAAELVIANEELTFQNEEKEKRAIELVAAYKELSIQNEEKEKRAEELIVAYKKLKKTAENQTEYRKGLEEMMFMTSHQLRSPIANILGILNHLDSLTISAEELEEMKGFLKQFAKSLDHSTRDLTTFIYNQGIKLNNDKDE